MAHLGGSPNDIDDVNDALFAEYRRSDAIANYDTIDAREYSTGNLYQDVASGDTIRLTIVNPSSSEDYLFVNGLVRSEGKVYFQKMLNVDITSTGTSLTAVQRRSDIDNGNVSEAYANSTVDTTNARKFNHKVLGGGEGQLQNPGAGAGPSTIVAPGDNVHYTVSNESGSNSFDISIDVDFSEIPTDLVDELTDPLGN